MVRVLNNKKIVNPQKVEGSLLPKCHHSEDLYIYNIKIKVDEVPEEVKSRIEAMTEKMTARGYTLIDDSEKLKSIMEPSWETFINDRHRNKDYFWLHKYSILNNIINDAEADDVCSLVKAEGLSNDIVAFLQEKGYLNLVSVVENGRLVITDKTGRIPKVDKEGNVVFAKNTTSGTVYPDKISPKIEHISYFLIKDVYEIVKKKKIEEIKAAQERLSKNKENNSKKLTSKKEEQ